MIMGACLLITGGTLSASTIAVYGTGDLAGSTTLQAAGGIDGNFTLISCPGGNTNCVSNGSGGSNAYVVQNAFPIAPNGPWIADSATSQWIGPDLNGDEGTQVNNPNLDAVGVYDYRETFTLTGFNLATVVLTGDWAVDNTSTIELNGIALTGTGQSITNPIGFNTLTSFTINSGFSQGVNTLDFLVTNAPPINGSNNPTGLRVDLSGTGTLGQTTVPEPASFAFVGLGLAGLGLLPLRQRRRS
jgi:MYXO-CTERM domain-containing protein